MMQEEQPTLDGMASLPPLPLRWRRRGSTPRFHDSVPRFRCRFVSRLSSIRRARQHGALNTALAVTADATAALFVAAIAATATLLDWALLLRRSSTQREAQRTEALGKSRRR